MGSFIKCDVDQDCLLNSEELTVCLENEDMKVVSTYLPDGFDLDYLVREIIFSLDNEKHGGLNLSSFLLLKRIIIGFRQFHVGGLVDKDTFYSSIKTTFADHLIDEMDSEMVYRLSISLMFEGIKSFQLNFANYFEACRLVYSFFAFGLTIGEGYLTKEQILRNYESDRYPSKLNTYMYENYFDLYSDDFKLNLNTELTKIDPNTLRFEDHATLEFWANIYSNYTDISMNIAVLNMTGFKNLVETNKYIRKKYWIYIAYSNFEDYSKINATYITPTNITDYDFLTNFNTNFLELSIRSLLNIKGKNKKNNLRVKDNSKIKLKNNKENLSVFDRLNTRTSSLFNLQLKDDDQGNQNQEKSNVSDIASLLDTALTYYFTILDINMNNYLTFEEFFIFIKYLRLFDRLNKNNGDRRGVLKSNCVNCNILYNFSCK
jgi:hypothetical protein